jgi:hypothetical protein
MIRLLDIEGGVVKPTEHCKIIKWLSIIQDVYPDNYLDIYAYLFYMSCRSQENPYFNVAEDLREETVLNDLNSTIPTEDGIIIDALEKTKRLYETPTVRVYKAMSTMLDNLAQYMETTKITAGRDGNINSLLRAAKELDTIRQSYKGIAKDLEAEQQTLVRGGQNLAYDQ